MRRIAAALLMLLFAGSAAPEARSAAEWSVEALLAQETASGFELSPDGRRAVWVKRFLSEEDKAYRHDLFLSELDGEDGPAAPLRLTRHEADDLSPRWSPGGGRIAFLSARDGGEDEEPDTQVWLLDLRGGEPEAATEVEGGVEDFRWLDDTRLLYLTGEGPTLRERELEEAGDGSIVVGDAEHWPPSRLFLLDLASGETRRVTENAKPIVSFEPSPDGRWVVGHVAEDLHFDYDFRRPPRVLLWDMESGDSREILAPEMHASRFVWDRKGEGFYFIRPFASDSADLFVSLDLLGYWELASGEWEAVDLEWDRGIDWNGFRATEKGALVELADGTRNRLLHIERKGRGKWKRRFFEPRERGYTIVLAVARDGKSVLYGRTDASQPMRYFAGEIAKDRFKEEHEFLRLNEQLDELPMPRTEAIRWTGALGDTVEGMLHYPVEYEAGERHPLVVMIHGGPTDADRDYFLEGWGGSPALFCARGAFVLRPNYHGSSGYGLAWMESIKGRYYELEVPDILAGVDHLVDAGLADESRLGVQGWSNGAILGIAACLDSGERFRVLDAGAGDVNWITDYTNCAFGAAFDDAYFGGPPWELPELYLDKSPLFRLENLTVPTLIHFGTEDVNVPTEQGWEFYRALQQVGKAPVRFLLYPGEDHSLMNPVHRHRQLNEQLDWFDRYLFESYEEPNEAFRKGSPLDLALRLADTARVERLFGEDLEGLLVPELVETGGLLVGRFEVTRAQWAAFTGEELSPADTAGDGNLPATGLSLEQAREYCRWLSGVTGLDCRLPSVSELEALREHAGEEENTLSWWAGYTPNRDDAARLAAKMSELEVNRSPLRTVGSFAPAGETGLYDLGGNAAEWAMTDDGAGRPLGPSAVTAPGPTTPGSTASAELPPAYVGLRVVASPPEVGAMSP